MEARPQPFVVVSTAHGTMIVNHNDHHTSDKWAYGVGHQILSSGSYDMQEIELAKFLVSQKAQDGHVLAIDAGANIGVHTIEWAKMLGSGGSVIAFEAQRAIYHALCGNIAINNCFNVSAHNYALGSGADNIEILVPDYSRPASFGSLELKQHDRSEFIGQKLEHTANVNVLSIDMLNLDQCDFIKIDVEGMEMEVLEGAVDTIEATKPIMLIEYIKVDKDELKVWLANRGYDVYPFNHNFIAVHKSDKMAERIHQDGDNIRIEGTE